MKQSWETIFEGLESRKQSEDEGPDYPGGTVPKGRERYASQRSPSTLENVGFRTAELPNGDIVRLYTIGALARVLGRRTSTIRSWEKKGWLPPPTYRTPAPRSPRLPDKASKGDRLYTEAQMRFLIEAVAQFNLDNRLFSDWEGFRNHILHHYPTTTHGSTTTS